jgi:putative ABC transport system permease protein
VIGESFVVGLLASAVNVTGIGLRSPEGPDERGRIDLPGQGVTVTPRAIVVGLVVGTVITVLSSIVPPVRRRLYHPSRCDVVSRAATESRSGSSSAAAMLLASP